MSTGIAHWPVTDVDTTACDMLDDLVAELTAAAGTSCSRS